LTVAEYILMRQDQLEHNGGDSLVIRCKWVKRLCTIINQEKDEWRGETEFMVGWDL